MALPITTKQIDGSMLIDEEISTQRSSTNDFYSADPDSAAKLGFQIKRGRSQQMSAKTMNGQAGMIGDRAIRHSGGAQSANKRRENGGVKRTSRVGAMGKPPSNYSHMFPPLNETSFSEQYKTFKALGGRKPPNVIGNNLEMSKDLQMRIRPTASNKPYFRRNLNGPNLDHHQESFAQAMAMMGPMPQVNQSVF
mmetsp:Transcript_22825/g.30433  ORF Transcript_22825/g.30433 Transcript_22825/m.30433 type:complete len:194 (+) Transcript_22825:1288-1869(+)